MPSDLEIAFNCIKAKRPRYDMFWNFYEGNHPLVYAASRLQEIFRHIDAHFSENWCSVVVDSVLERVRIESFNVNDEEAMNERLNRLWLDTGLILDSYDAHLCALVTGEAAIMVGLDDDGNVEAYYNDSRLIHVQYDPEHPRVMQFAAKLWDDRDEYGKRVWYLTLYYPDRFEQHSVQKEELPDNARGFTSVDSMPNPYGLIPLFHFTTDRRAMVSELQNVINPQNQLNKILADMMVAAEFGAFKQRYIISQVETKTPLKNKPGLVWDIQAGDGVGQPTQVGELSETELGNYLAALDRGANVIAAISRTPKHYFFQTGDVPSGEALRAMESPLTKKATRYAERFEPTWRALGAFLLQLAKLGTFAANDLDVVWTEPATDTPLTEGQTVQTYVAAGVPLRTALRRQGWSDTELEQMDADRQLEEQAQATTDNQAASVVQSVLDRVRANGNQPNNANGVPVNAQA